MGTTTALWIAVIALIIALAWVTSAWWRERKRSRTLADSALDLAKDQVTRAKRDGEGRVREAEDSAVKNIQNAQDDAIGRANEAARARSLGGWIRRRIKR
jgi:Flp pilus assembly protein TadB